jgi:hypothetical protein
VRFEWDEGKAAANLAKHDVSFNEAATVELRPEYDFARMPGGVRGKYAAAYRRGTNLARLDPDVAEVFSTDRAVNEALRAMLRSSGGSVNPPAAADAASRRR